MTDTMQPIKDEVPRTLAARATAQIEDFILSGRLKPGDRLRIEELAATLEMSPMPIREALQRLESLGFAEHLPHRGARVRSLSSEDLVDLYSVRVPFEALATYRAAKNFTAQHAERAGEALRKYTQFEEAGDPAGARESHLEFHFSIYEAAGSHWLLRSIRPLCENGERYRLAALKKRGPLESRRVEHQQILDACVANDPEKAAEATVNHLLSTVLLLAPEIELDAEQYQRVASAVDQKLAPLFAIAKELDGGSDR